MAGTFLAAAADLPALAPETLTKIEALDQQLHAVPTAVPIEWRAAHAELVTQIRAGKLDASKLDPFYAAAEKIRLATRTRELAAIEALHGYLSASDRKSVAETIRKQQSTLDTRMTVAAKLDAWHQQLHDRLLRDLTLDATQTKQLDAALAKLLPAPPAIDAATIARDKNHEVLLTAFESETFDATHAAANVDPQAPRADRREIDFVAAILPILKGDQRDRFAGFLTRMGARGPEGAAFAGALDGNDVFSDSAFTTERPEIVGPSPRPMMPEHKPIPGMAPSASTTLR
jgi:hypothetical protein